MTEGAREGSDGANTPTQVVLNLKVNLEMNLSARLGTAANTGLLDDEVDDGQNAVSLHDDDNGTDTRVSLPPPRYLSISQ